MCACMCVDVFHRLAPLHAEKADISRGSVIERILLPASLRHGGWRECWIVGRDARGEIGEKAVSTAYLQIRMKYYLFG